MVADLKRKTPLMGQVGHACTRRVDPQDITAKGFLSFLCLPIPKYKDFSMKITSILPYFHYSLFVRLLSD